MVANVYFRGKGLPSDEIMERLSRRVAEDGITVRDQRLLSSDCVDYLEATLSMYDIAYGTTRKIVERHCQFAVPLDSRGIGYKFQIRRDDGTKIWRSSCWYELNRRGKWINRGG